MTPFSTLASCAVKSSSSTSPSHLLTIALSLPPADLRSLLSAHNIVEMVSASYLEGLARMDAKGRAGDQRDVPK
jgi:hypothetical protein